MANSHVKTLIKVVSCILLLTGCRGERDIHYISKSLDAVLADYISRYPQDSIISLAFHTIENRTLLDVGHSPYYSDVGTEGCFRYNDKLVVYFLQTNDSLACSHIDFSLTKEKSILSQYKTWNEAECEYDGNPNIETYFVLSKDSIRKATENDLRYHELVTDTVGIKSISLNNLINQRLNNNNSSIIAIRFALFENNTYLILSDIDVYAKKNLSGCLKRNGRIITFYNEEKIPNRDIIDKQLIKQSLPVLNDYKELSSDVFDYLSISGDLYRLSSDGVVHNVKIEEWPEDKYNLLYEEFHCKGNE